MKRVAEQIVVLDEDIRRLEQMVGKARQELDDLKAIQGELEMPEVFELHPLSSQRVMVKALKDEPARFYFVDDDDK